ncbi:MAG TPA: TetR/AcrR family transcriptional regulator [Noviherbaspirillum sp.]|jgi:AcrR family transcriptional regulator|uniref:TetR/AcrR family transcriptional regulator n=1 Tax=Noviherbaspirillum sp. TaxID=1926288 RepID=UPI002DDD67C7|nr:TetR/AcrR family transcriptional regulator [Noviherbaspirillum sp.]HEV2611952.1 TetR/AcrR family transcriptional regulator [Noviherbaspirillum sp.]
MTTYNKPAQQPEKKSRKQEILDAALSCFIENGVEATTIEMIRERSAASVGSLYHHFGNKESIAAAIYVQAMQSYHEAREDYLSKARDAEEGVKAIVHSYIDWVADNPDKARFVLYNRGAVVRSDAAGELEAQTKSHLSQALRWFKPYRDSGSLKDVPLECYPSLIIGPAHDYARLWLAGRVKSHIRVHREVFADAAWNALKL